jgi:ParB family chromosome partitioning protein
MKAHDRRATIVVELEERVAEIIAALKDRGLQSPYLRSFVVARINPLRWPNGDDVPPAEKVLETMLSRSKKFNVEKVRQQHLVGGYGPVDEE